MATLTFHGETYAVDHAVKGADYIHGYDANGVLVVAFDGVKDFSCVTYTGVYMEPGECLTEHCNTVRYCGGALKTLGGKVVMLTSPSEVEEWANPPMVVGVEYRTTERYMGKPVYVKAVACGDAPQGTSSSDTGAKTVAHGVSSCRMLHCYGTTNAGIALPYESAAGGWIRMSAHATAIVMRANYENEATGIVAIIKYYKGTD